MKITLVTASFNDLVHGTFNDKKTGCGINLMKPETASRYHKGGEMNYLGEITCEKCKAKIAKEMIKADSKEMKALLKEEKLRAKKGMDDEGLVQLSELKARPTSVAPPEPEPPVVPTENVQVNADNPAYSDDLAQFAIKKPQETSTPVEEESEDDFLAQFAIKKPQETPAPAEEESEDDFLAQFAIKKPTEEINTSKKDDDDDFLAQFSVSSPERDTSYEEEPPAPPVIDDISDALSAMQNSPITSLRKESESEKDQSDDDILSMFAIDNSTETEKTDTTGYINSNIMDDDDESIFDSMTSDDDTSMNSASEWDIIANQLFGDISSEEQPKPPVIDDISVPEIEDITVPAPDNIPVSEIKETEIPALDEISVPKIEDIEAPALDDISVPEIKDVEIPVPEIEDIEIPAPEIKDVEIPAPEIEDIEIPAPDESPVPEPVAAAKPEHKQTTPPPVQQAPKAAAIPPVQPIPNNITPPPVQPIMPPPVAPVQPMTAPAGMNMGMGQIVTVPQLTGYDPKGQPIYAYMQMILQGYDQNGQPIMIPMPQNIMGMPMQMPVQPAKPAQPEYSSLSKNSRLQAVLDSLDEPVAEKDMTIGQKIAAAEAAKGSPISANVSKIATNPHAKSTSQAFINAISESKDDTQSLTETQGLKPKTMVLDSIEDVLSQLGDNSLKEKKEAEAKLKKNIPIYEEFKTPSRTQSSSFSRPVPSSSRTFTPNMSDVPLTKAQQKELKKQQKIDAKFQKEMAKRNK